MAAAAILDFLIFENLTVGTLKRAKMRHRVKFRRSQSVIPRPKYGNFSILQDGGRRHLGFSKFLIFNSRRPQEGRNVSPCMPDLVEIGGTYAEIWRFFDFSRWWPSAILDLLCGDWTTHVVRRLVIFITLQNSDGIDAVVLIICKF